MSIDLLEYVTLTSGEMYISDLLRHKGSVCRVLERMGDATLFSIGEWNDSLQVPWVRVRSCLWRSSSSRTR